MRHAAHIIDHKLIGYEPSCARVRALARSARRFVFDDAAAAFMGSFVRTSSDIIIHNRQFAMPPFPVTYLEWSSKSYIGAIGAETIADFTALDDDDRLAYLISGSHVWTIAWNTQTRGSGCTLFEYDMNTPWRGDKLFSDTSEQVELWTRMSLLLGTSSTVLDDDGHDLRDIVNNTRITMPGRAQLRDTSTDSMRRLAQHCYGDLRNVWIALLMINQPRHGVSTQRIPHQTGLLRGKRHVYAAHSVVSIDLTAREYSRAAAALGLSRRESPRRHGVRGHFMHYHGREGCEHAWPIDPIIENEVPRWTCGRCGRLRVWREAFSRGDATKGFTTNEYELTT